MLINHKEAIHWLDEEIDRIIGGEGYEEYILGLSKARDVIARGVKDKETEDRIRDRKYEAECEAMEEASEATWY